LHFCTLSDHARLKLVALTELEKFFTYFVTRNHDQMVSLFVPDVLFVAMISPELAMSRLPKQAFARHSVRRRRGTVKYVVKHHFTQSN
jgi:hypothetical protein